MQQVIEPLGVRRSTGAILALFAVVGTGAGIAIFSSGEWFFAVLFAGMFIGIPWLIHQASRGPGVPGFTLTTDGILGAAEDEQRLIGWAEVDHLAWRTTGLTVNNAACLALHAVLADGRSVRVMTYTARRGREVEDIEAQVDATGLLPERVRFGAADGSSRDATGSRGASEVRSWQELPTGVKVMLVTMLLAFFGPFALMLLVVPILLFAFAGPFAWIATAVLVAAAAVFLKALGQRRREPVLSCAFTVEGVVSEFGDGLTVPWHEDAVLRVDTTFADVGTVPPGGGGQGWVLRLHRPEASPLQLSPVLTSLSRVERAVGELVFAKSCGMIPTDVQLTLPVDLPPDVVQRLGARWYAAHPDH